MKHDSTISKINRDLIRTFASLDAWFDKTLDDGFTHDDPWSTLDVLQHMITSNNHFLNILSEGYDYALAAFTQQGRSDFEKSLYAMRFALREQLYHCLCLLDELDESTTNEDTSKQMNLHHKLMSLSNHLQYHLDSFERVKNEEPIVSGK